MKFKIPNKILSCTRWQKIDLINFIKLATVSERQTSPIHARPRLIYGEIYSHG